MPWSHLGVKGLIISPLRKIYRMFCTLRGRESSSIPALICISIRDFISILLIKGCVYSSNAILPGCFGGPMFLVELKSFSLNCSPGAIE